MTSLLCGICAYTNTHISIGNICIYIYIIILWYTYIAIHTYTCILRKGLLSIKTGVECVELQEILSCEMSQTSQL